MTLGVPPEQDAVQIQIAFELQQGDPQINICIHEIQKLPKVQGRQTQSSIMKVLSIKHFKNVCRNSADSLIYLSDLEINFTIS